MECYTEISSVANTIKKFHIQYNFHSGYKHNLYNDKQGEIDDIFDRYIKTLLKYINYPALIQEWKQNLDAAAYEKS